MIKDNKILKFTLFMIIIILAVFIYIQYFVMQKYFEQNIKHEQQMINKMYNLKIEEMQNRYEKRLKNILTIPEIKEGIKTQNSEILKRNFIDKFKKIQKENKFVKTMLITDTNNVVILRAHKPKMYNDDLTTVRPIIKKANETKKTYFGFEAGKMSIPYRVTIPIIYDGIHYGVVDMGISSNYLIEYINKISHNAEATSLLNKEFLKIFIKTTYLNKTPIKRGFLAPKFNKFFEPFFDKIDLNKDISQVTLNNKTYLINTTFKMTSFDKTSFGTILVSYDISDEISKQQNNIFRILFFIVLIIGIIYIILRYYEKELKKQVQSYETLFQNSHDGILIIKNNKFVDCNKAVVDMLKYDNKLELLDTHPSEFSPKVQSDGEDSFAKANRMMQLAVDNGSHRFEWIYTRRDGEDFWCEVSLTSMHIDKEDIIHASWRDITVVKEMEKLAQKIIEQKTKEYKEATKKAQSANKAKSEFLANMSHEIRTPLNAIMGFIDLLKDEEKDKDKIDYLTTMDKSSHNLLEIINDILDFSKIENDQLELEYRDFDPIEEFETIADLFKVKMLEKNINFEVDIDENLPKLINSDPLRIKQVLINLLSNAVKFTNEDKAVFLKVSYCDEKLTVSIKDDGIGIPLDKQEIIFKAFMQADNSTTRKYGGTGLGLAIGYKLVSILNGVLKVKSEVNKGSEFYFTIPVKESKQKEQKILLEKESKKLNGHILIVEDNKANQMYIKIILKKMNLTFDIAFNGLEAVEKFKNSKQNQYDVVLMDENMPVMNGIEATKQILEYEKQNNLSHTPIIALTANALKGDRERFLSAGMDEYMTKPVDKKKLNEVLSNFLSDIKNG